MSEFEGYDESAYKTLPVSDVTKIEFGPNSVLISADGVDLLEPLRKLWGRDLCGTFYARPDIVAISLQEAKR